MKRSPLRLGRGAILVVLSQCLAMTGCAEQQQSAQTIEPLSEPLSGGVSASTPTSPGPTRPAPAASDFVLSREPPSAGHSRAEQPIHIGETWWRFRGEGLRLTDDQARERDAAVSAYQPPAAFWDDQTAIEAVSVWGVLCNQCHGGRRRVQDAIAMPPPPDAWGRGEGLFFGARRPYVEVFAMVNNGGPIHDSKRAMPAWRNVLAREQIWAMLYFLEYQSGGIEGRFPPSLYPRMQSDAAEPPR